MLEDTRAEDTPNGNLLYLNKPRWVLITTYLHELSSRRIRWYAWLMSNFVNHLPPTSDVKKSSALGIGYLSNLEALLTVSL